MYGLNLVKKGTGILQVPETELVCKGNGDKQMKKWMNIGMIVLIFCIVGCGKRNEVGEKTKAPIQDDTVFFEIIEVEKEKELSVEVTKKNDVYVKENSAELAKYNAANRLRSNDVSENQNSLFCIDSATGAVYFVNQNQDWYIYCLQNDKVELVVPLPARELYMWEGTLYFIIEDYDRYELTDVKENDIYAYSPAAGSVVLVYSATELNDASESHLGVDENGLHLIVSKKGEEIELNGKKGYKVKKFSYLLPFFSKELVEDPYLGAISGWKEYYQNSGSLFVHREFGGEDIIQLDVAAHQSCIIEDKFYSVDVKKVEFYITDMVSREIKCYDCKPVMEKVVVGGLDRAEKWGEVAHVNSFTVTKDYVWLVAYGSYLVRIEPESGEMKCFVTEVLNMTEPIYCFIEKLYTDGENIYALYESGSTDSVPYLVQIKTDEILEDEIFLKVPVLAVEKVIN